MNPNSPTTGPIAPNTEIPIDPVIGAEEHFFGGGKKKLILLVGGILAFILVLIISLLVFLSRSQGSSEDEKITLTYWTVWENPEVYKPIIDEFHKQNPNITVNVELQDIKTLGKYIDRLTTRIQSGENAPDIYRFHNSWIPELKNLLLPLPKGVVDEVGLEQYYYQGAAKAVSYKGAYYAVPLYTDTLMMFVNKKIFSDFGYTSYPNNWDSLRKVSQELKTVEEGKVKTAGVAMGTFDNVAHSSDILSLLMIQNGVDFQNMEATQEQAKQALLYYNSFANGDWKTWDDTLEDSKLAFAKGNVAMYFGYSWDILGIRAVNPLLEYEIVPVPKVPLTNQTITSFWVEGVSSGSPHAEAAFKFLTFMSSKENLQKIFENQAKLRVVSGVYPRRDMENLLSSNPQLLPFAKEADNAEPTIFSSDTYDQAMVDELNQYLGDAMRAINQGTSAETAIDTLISGVQQILGRYEPIQPTP